MIETGLVDLFRQSSLGGWLARRSACGPSVGSRFSAPSEGLKEARWATALVVPRPAPPLDPYGRGPCNPPRLRLGSAAACAGTSHGGDRSLKAA